MSRRKAVELEVLEFTDMPEEIQELLQARKIIPDFCCMVALDDLLAWAIHAQDNEEGMCIMLLFTFMHGILWQMMLETTKAMKLHRVISHFVHEDVPHPTDFE